MRVQLCEKGGKKETMTTLGVMVVILGLIMILMDKN